MLWSPDFDPSGVKIWCHQEAPQWGLLRRHQRALQGLSGVALRSLWDLRAPDSDPSGSESVTPSGQVHSDLSRANPLPKGLAPDT